MAPKKQPARKTSSGSSSSQNKKSTRGAKGRKQKDDAYDDALLDAAMATNSGVCPLEQLAATLMQHPPPEDEVRAAHPDKTDIEIAEFRASDVVTAVDVFWAAPAIKTLLEKERTTKAEGLHLAPVFERLRMALWYLHPQFSKYSYEEAVAKQYIPDDCQFSGQMKGWFSPEENSLPRPSGDVARKLIMMSVRLLQQVPTPPVASMWPLFVARDLVDTTTTLENASSSLSSTTGIDQPVLIASALLVAQLSCNFDRSREFPELVFLGTRSTKIKALRFLVASCRDEEKDHHAKELDEALRLDNLSKNQRTDTELSCPICLSECIAPLLFVPCGHVVCQSCHSEGLQKTKSCVMCRQRVTAIEYWTTQDAAEYYTGRVLRNNNDGEAIYNLFFSNVPGGISSLAEKKQKALAQVNSLLRDDATPTFITNTPPAALVHALNVLDNEPSLDVWVSCVEDWVKKTRKCCIDTNERRNSTWLIRGKRYTMKSLVELLLEITFVAGTKQMRVFTLQVWLIALEVMLLDFLPEVLDGTFTYNFGAQNETICALEIAALADYAPMFQQQLPQGVASFRMARILLNQILCGKKYSEEEAAFINEIRDDEQAKSFGTTAQLWAWTLILIEQDSAAGPQFGSHQIPEEDRTLITDSAIKISRNAADADFIMTAFSTPYKFLEEQVFTGCLFRWLRIEETTEMSAWWSAEGQIIQQLKRNTQEFYDLNQQKLKHYTRNWEPFWTAAK